MSRGDVIGIAGLAIIVGVCFIALSIGMGLLWPDLDWQAICAVVGLGAYGIGAGSVGVLLAVRVRMHDRDTVVMVGNRSREMPVARDLSSREAPSLYGTELLDQTTEALLQIRDRLSDHGRDLPDRSEKIRQKGER